MKQQTNILTPLQAGQLPDAYVAKALYEEMYNGNLQFENEFGIDPLADHENLRLLRQSEFEESYSLAEIFGECANERPRLFQESILRFIDITSRLFSLL